VRSRVCGRQRLPLQVMARRQGEERVEARLQVLATILVSCSLVLNRLSSVLGSFVSPSSILAGLGIGLGFTSGAGTGAGLSTGVQQLMHHLTDSQYVHACYEFLWNHPCTF
jgi:hypothetical protein